MKVVKAILASWVVLALSTTAAYADVKHSVTGVGGYDLVSYHDTFGPVPGNGHHVSEVEGVTYLFANKSNKKKFDRSPEKYLPAYGGYCAYGVAYDKKFFGDPKVWEVVDGRLYLNLDEDIQSKWAKDKQGLIGKADSAWPKIRNKHYSEL